MSEQQIEDVHTIVRPLCLQGWQMWDELIDAFERNSAELDRPPWTCQVTFASPLTSWPINKAAWAALEKELRRSQKRRR